MFYLNINTVVPASWGNVAGTRSSLSNWLNILQQAIGTPVVLAVLGIMIIRRYPGHQVGWLFILISLISSSAIVLGEVTVYSYFTASTPLPGIEWAAWVNNWFWVVLYTLLLYMLAIFPDGKFTSRRWRIILSIMLAWFSLGLIIGSAIETPMSSSFQIPNPLDLGALKDLSPVIVSFGIPAMPIAGLTLVASAVVRFRRGQGRERQQMKWLLAGVSLLALMVIIGLLLSEIPGFAIGEMMVNASILGPVLGIGAALLRHQLYDIDIIIRRTLVYSAVSVLLAAIYFGSVVLLQGLVAAVGGQQSGIVVVFSTLVIAALFNPVRKRVQIFVDQRFYRQKYDSAQILNQFSVATRDEVDMDALTAALVRAVQDTMYPEQVTLWLKSDN